MCWIHNLFFRNLNAVILQYEQVSEPEDVADFMIFCQCVHEGIQTHHHHEEEFFFPEVEAYTGQNGLMETNVEQHHEFEEGLKKFGEYVYSVKPEKYDPKTFKEILDSFMPALVKHLNDEIPTLLALEKYGGDKLMQTWKDVEKKILSGAIDPVSHLPNVQSDYTDKTSIV
jgi:hemerythrin-like domain-containing protein